MDGLAAGPKMLGAWITGALSSLLPSISIAAFDRFLFAFTIASHIILVSASISLIVLMSIGEFIAIRRDDAYYGTLLKRLTKVFVVSFGIGTASGIVMAVELVGLFPSFMTLVSETGAISLLYAEVFAFFLEIIALVLYVYYASSFRNRYMHWVLSLFIAAGALFSALLITMLNAWMNTPNGFDMAAFVQSGTVSGVNPWAPFITASTVSEVSHTLVTTLFAGSMIWGGYFAWRYLKTRDTDERVMLSKGLKVIGAIAIVMIILSGLSGSIGISNLLQNQPLKFAALEANVNPGTDLPEELFGGISNGQFTGGILIPGLQSLLARLGTGITQLPGLSQFPPSTWPPLVVHTVFDVMMTGGVLLGVFFFLYFVAWALKKKPYEYKPMLAALVMMSFIAMLVYELGWATDELGRQPWIVYEVMTVSQAANPVSSLLIPGVLIVIFYLMLIPTTFYFFARVFNAKPVSEEMKEGQAVGGGVNY